MRVKLELALSPAERGKLTKAINREFSKFAGRCVDRITEEVIKTQPMNSGRTLRSWHWSFSGELKDAGPQGPYKVGMYDATNNLPIGTEPGRGYSMSFPRLSASTIKNQLKSNPYRVVYFTNGAELDSIEPVDNSLAALQGAPGARAWLQEYGIIPGYGLYQQHFNVFEPRGEGMFRLAIMDVKRNPYKPTR